VRKLILLFCLALAVTIVGGAPAEAATTSVTGTGSYEKLVVNNAAKNLIFKIHAPGGACSIKYVSVKFRDRDGTRYALNGGCYPGATWAVSLERGANLIDCADLRLRYNTDKGVWTGTIPRDCLRGLGAAVKVTESYVDDYSPTINEVSGTGYVRQG
jgi:hypothetical protein